jgi:HAD superfamily hydrolase (TIGR01509 family)
VPSLIFDCDGVLAETERDGHLVAFNRMFEEYGLPVRWSEAEYAALLSIGGGKERLRHLLTREFVLSAGLPDDASRLDEEVAGWHRRKTQIFTDLVASGAVPGRPGVARVVAAAQEAGWSLGVASTSAEPSVQAVLEHVVGQQLARTISVYAGDIVTAKKPAPDIYLAALDGMGATAATTIVVEDSRIGLLAATRAGLRCLVTPSGFTQDELFDEADLVVSCLGDPHGEPARVLENRSSVEPAGIIDVADLEQLLSADRDDVGMS